MLLLHSLTLILLLINASARPSKSKVKLASFNIQIYGLAKSKKGNVMNILAKTICRFDAVFIQEIREKNEDAFNSLIKTVNNLCGNTTRYEGIAGPRHGKTMIKEQIGVIYRPKIFKIDGLIELKNLTNQFERPPDCFVITRREDKLKIAVLAAHLDPQHVATEMEALYDAAPKCKYHAKTENLLLLGDMNADCGYLSKSKRNNLRLRKDSNYKWLVPDGMDTTVGKTSCTYDRIIANGRRLLEVTSQAGVFDFEQRFGLERKMALSVSDHYPVEVEVK